MTRFDLTPLYRSTVGFDRLFNLLDTVNGYDTSSQSYPPYNIERLDEDSYRITMAVAGFAQDDIEIEVRDNALSVSARKVAKDDEAPKNYLHQGIAERSFERRFSLADYVVVTGANLENGLLNIDLARQIPDEKKPRRIEIGSATPAAKIKGAGAKAIEDKAA